MKVTGVILAAGLGTRLRPSTDHCPKPLIPVGGIEPLFFALKSFHSLGIRRVVINAHYLNEQISDALKRWSSLLPGLECRVSVEMPEILGTGGGLFKMFRDFPEWFKGSGVLLQNGDTLAHMPLQRFLAEPERSSFGISLREEHLKKYKPLWIDAKNAWVGIGPTAPEPGASAAHFLGIHYLSPKAIAQVLELSPQIENIDLFNGIYRPLSDMGFEFKSLTFFDGPPTEHFWFDMNTPEYLLEAQRFVLESLMSSPVWRDLLQVRYPDIREISRGVWVLSPSDDSSRTFYAPAVMVESMQQKSPRSVGPLILGPHASFISERGAIGQDASKAGLEIRNAVVMVGAKPVDAVLPKRILNEIRVL